VTNGDSGTISQYAIGTNGALTALNPPTVAAGSGPNYVTVDYSGKYVYATNYHSSTISQYTICPNGALTALNPPTVAAGYSPYCVITVSKQK
jgi:6-phosphogluconolactonase (cycloisomerase 2 family)